jgi:uncharacterized protein (DUF1800 family)
MSSRQALIALRRFGLGAKSGDIAKATTDPRGFVLAQFDRRAEILLDDPDLEPSHVTFAAAAVAQQQQRLARLIPREAVLDAAQQTIAKNSKLDNTEQRAAARAQRPLTDAEMKAVVQSPQQKAGRIRVENFVDEATVRFRHQATTDAALPERLAMFWSNHFCVVARGPVRGIAGAYEREAIRPHVLGRFADMLKAVEQHPAMLIYLDNQLSFGPNSQAGKNQKKGLNENLAREILELHTLGVDGGYTQTDVTNFARIITGWTVANLNTPGVAAGKFFYHAPRHEPGEWPVLGKTYPDRGMQTGLQCLEDFAKHPGTARHVARKLAAHFVADDPPPSLVAKLEKNFRDTEGNLAEVTRTLVTADEAWAPDAKKLLPPIDLVVALSRSLLHKVGAGEMLRLSLQLGQPLWQPGSPKGFPDDDNGWTNPSALNERLRIAEQVARLLDKSTDPRALAEAVLGPDMRPETRQAIARAETREQGLELLIMSPDFQRR